MKAEHSPCPARYSETVDPHLHALILLYISRSTKLSLSFTPKDIDIFDFKSDERLSRGLSDIIRKRDPSQCRAEGLYGEDPIETIR